MKTDEEYYAEFEDLGEPAVAAKIQSGFAGKRLKLASAWLTAKNRERELRTESANSESLKTAKSTKTAVWVAAIAGIAAVIITYLVK